MRSGAERGAGECRAESCAVQRSVEVPLCREVLRCRGAEWCRGAVRCCGAARLEMQKRGPCMIAPTSRAPLSSENDLSSVNDIVHSEGETKVPTFSSPLLKSLTKVPY